MPAARNIVILAAAIALSATGCVADARTEQPVSPEEQVLLDQLTRDNFVEIMATDRDDLDHLVVTTRQGSQRVRYIIKPSNPGERTLNLHKINDRSMLEISESDQLGTGPQPGPNGRYR